MLEKGFCRLLIVVFWFFPGAVSPWSSIIYDFFQMRIVHAFTLYIVVHICSIVKSSLGKKEKITCPPLLINMFVVRFTWITIIGCFVELCCLNAVSWGQSFLKSCVPAGSVLWTSVSADGCFYSERTNKNKLAEEECCLGKLCPEERISLPYVGGLSSFWLSGLMKYDLCLFFVVWKATLCEWNIVFNL